MDAFSFVVILPQKLFNSPNLEKLIQTKTKLKKILLSFTVPKCVKIVNKEFTYISSWSFSLGRDRDLWGNYVCEPSVPERRVKII